MKNEPELYANTAYEVTKAVYPIKTTANAGVDVHSLVKEKYPEQYEKLQLSTFDWDKDLDGALDFLYGEREIGFLCMLFGVQKSDVSEIIKLIESNCEIKK